MELLPGICAGLGHAHEHKVLHRDLKPSNIMLTSDGTVKICDFGIARQTKDSMSRITGQQTSGTLLYMSPEQLRGKKTDRRSDIYSLGIVLYELLSGNLPFVGGDPSLQHLHESPEPIEGISEKTWYLVSKCLEKSPVDRFETAEQLKSYLESFSMSPPGNTRTTCPRAAIAVIAVLIAGIGLLSIKGLITPHKEGTKEPIPTPSPYSAAPTFTGTPMRIDDKQETHSSPGASAGKERLPHNPEPTDETIYALPLADTPKSRTAVEPTDTPAAIWQLRERNEHGYEEADLKLTIGATFRFVHIPNGSLESSSWMGKYEITNAQYEAFTKDVPDYLGKKDADEDYLRHWREELEEIPNSPNAPVVYVSWKNCLKFCEWLSGKTNHVPVGLPSEKEWEHACLAGSKSPYCFDETSISLDAYAWYCENSGGRIQNIGQKSSNAWGLYDMHGNVWEWCARQGRSSTGDEIMPIKGGAFSDFPEACKTDLDLAKPAKNTHGNLGFRIVLRESSKPHDK